MGGGFERLPGIPGGHSGCLHCGEIHETLPMDSIVAVGFGYAGVTRDGEEVFTERSGGEEFRAVQEFEDMAKDDPDHDWRIHKVGPFKEVHYQRHGDGHWVLYEKGEGFA